MAPTALDTIETIAIEDDPCTGGPQAGECVYCSGPETD
ncbi:hypothetical protein J2W21_003734 [Sinomonas atrocyanea]|nr:hypothetical protein [Sinomonas atrocyanea]